MTDRYRLYGLTVDSEIALHHHVADGGNGTVDVTIQRGPQLISINEISGTTLCEYGLDSGVGYVYFRRPDGQYVLRYQDLCDFIASPELDHVEVRIKPGEDDGIVSVLLSGSVLSFILIMRGEPVLHASAVDVGGRAVAFVGASGMGKSTMATLLCAAGATLITDDVLRLKFDRDQSESPTCYLGPTELRLRKAADELTEMFLEEPARRTTGDEREAIRVRAAAQEHLPLTALVVPMPQRETSELVLEELPKKDAILALVSFPRIVGWQDSAALDKEFQHAAAIADIVPVFRAHVPWGPPFQADLATQILKAMTPTDTSFIDRHTAVFLDGHSIGQRVPD